MNAQVSSNRLGAVIGAFFYLQGTSFYNRLKQRLLRLRQPKYLLGSLAAGAYMYFFFFRRLIQGGHSGRSHALMAGMTPELAAQFAALAAFALCLWVVGDWVLSGERARLQFTETEIAFLFPAPLTRTTLIQFNLLRSQLAIFVSAFLVGLFLGRGSALGASPLQYAISIWLVQSILKLHTLAASFTRERLLDLGVRPMLRRSVLGGLLALAALACWWWMRPHLYWPTADVWADGAALRAWFVGIVESAPLSWLLIPFHWIVDPFFAPDAAHFLRALAPALALLVVHYVWVVRSQVAFEEASMDYARRRAERLAARREGRLRVRNGPAKPRSEPFRLAARGPASIPFLWKGLIEMGPFWRIRTWLIAGTIVFALCQWMAADPERRRILLIFGTATSALGAWILFLGPMMLQRGLRRTLENLDILKAAPLRGWQIALGELLTPIAVMSFSMWLLLIGVESIATQIGHGELTAANLAATTVGIAVLAPPLSGLMLCLPFAGLLYFPAWTATPGAGGRGFEVMGQRLIFMGGYLVTLIVTAIPAALLGGIAYALANRMAGEVPAILAAALIATATLVLELVFAVDLLGRRIDRFDVSQELR